MKMRWFVLLFALLSLTAGCNGQQMTPTPIVTAPAVTSTLFTQLNATAPVTALNYTDLPPTGSFCYFVQELDGTGISAASNTACSTTTATLKHIALNWSAPVGYVCQNSPCTYVVSRAPATVTPVGVPSMAAPVNEAELLITLKISTR